MAIKKKVKRFGLKSCMGIHNTRHQVQWRDCQGGHHNALFFFPYGAIFFVLNTRSGNQRRNDRNKNWTGRLENYKDALERGTTRREDDTAQQHQYKGDQAHVTMLN
jgi:hypothetical protein